MREIKFRAWNKDFKEWSDTAMKYAIQDINYYTDYEWMQYTGLKDKNGVEIYEGDIVIKEGSWISEFIGNVIYRECSWWIDNDYAAVGLWSEIDELKVIGNIYENPELLKGGK